MELREEHPQLYELSQRKTHPAWRADVPISHLGVLPFLLSEIGAAEADDLDGDVFARSRALREEVLSRKQREEEIVAKKACDVLNVFLCIPAMGTAIHSGQLGTAYDWIVFSLSDLDEVGIQQEVEPSRILDCFVTSSALGVSQIAPVLLEWASFFFYFCRKRAVLHEACDEIAPIVSQAIDDCLATTRDEDVAIDCLLNMACWAVHFSHSPVDEIVARLEDLYSKEELDSRLRAQIGVCLTTAVGVKSSRPPEDWADDVLENLRDQLVGHEECQVLCGSVTNEERAYRLRSEIIQAARDHARHVFTQQPSPTEARYGFERLFDILTPLITVLGHLRDGDYLTELLSAWYGVAEGPRRGLLFLYSNPKETVWFTDERHAVAIGQPSEDRPAALTAAMNDFLGTTITVDGERDFELLAPKRLGVPSETLAERYLKLIQSTYGLNHEGITDPFREYSEAIVMLPHLMAPIQTAILHAAEWTLPVSTSLRTPLADRPVESVLLWPGGTFVDEIELGAVQHILESHGIEVERVAPAERNKRRFQQFYSSSRHDVIWVTAHTEYNHFSPHLSYITLDSVAGEAITLGELEQLSVQHDMRRLLVLNVCDGATGAVLGGAMGLGVAQMLAQPTQAVISHMWPVDQRIAPVFGALLARELVNVGDSFFESFKKAILRMKASKEQLIETLRDTCGPQSSLVERVENRDYDPTSMYFWGSPVFLE